MKEKVANDPISETITVVSHASDMSNRNRSRVRDGNQHPRRTTSLQPQPVRFFCNGDQFYSGQRVYVSSKRYPNFDRLLADLSRTLTGVINLPYGVRQIFRADDGKRVNSIEEIIQSQCKDFVCSGFETFRPMLYGQKKTARWNIGKLSITSLHPPGSIPPTNSKYRVLQESSANKKVNTIATDAEVETFGLQSQESTHLSITATTHDENTNYKEIRVQRQQLQSSNVGTCHEPKRWENCLLVDEGFLMQNFEIGRILGEGNFAVVKRCRERKTGTEYAVKIISSCKMKKIEKVVGNELAMLSKCHHPNIIGLFNSYETKTAVYFITELVEGGDLFDAIRRSQKFSEDEASSMVTDMAMALQYLHQKNIVHRDVKLENLLVQRNKDGSIRQLKLADFGLAVVAEGILFKLCGTATYVAPEMLSYIGYGLEVDMWSAGVIMYILLSGYPPFRCLQSDDSKLFETIKEGRLVFDSPHWDLISEDAKDMIRNLLERKIKYRLTADDVLNHRWIRNGNMTPCPSIMP